jgi:hypothetical protein
MRPLERQYGQVGQSKLMTLAALQEMHDLAWATVASAIFSTLLTKFQAMSKASCAARSSDPPEYEYANIGLAPA